MFASGVYLGGMEMQSSIFAAVGGCCLVSDCIAFCAYFHSVVSSY